MKRNKQPGYYKKRTRDNQMQPTNQDSTHNKVTLTQDTIKSKQQRMPFESSEDITLNTCQIPDASVGP